MVKLNKKAALVFAVMGLSPVAAQAQMWGDQAPVNFRFSNQSSSNEAARVQLGASAIGAAAAVANSNGINGSGGGSGQASGQSLNTVQEPITVTITGSGNTLNVTGNTTTQKAEGTSQSAANTSQSNSNSTGTVDSSPSNSSTILNP